MREKKSGLIINTASLVSHASTAILGWYASTKHAVKGMTDALRMEVKHLGIDVVLIEPGAVKTEFDEVAFATMDAIDHPEDYRHLAANFKKLAKSIYAKSPGPESTADAVVKANKAKKPKIRYATTIDAKVLPKVKRLLGDRIFDKIALSLIK